VDRQSTLYLAPIKTYLSKGNKK